MVAGALVLALGLPGCADYPLHANMLDPEFSAVLGENFAPGMTRGEVDDRLTALRVRRQDRWLYAGNPPHYLARVYRPGGRWLSDEDAMMRWVDTWFVFDGSEPAPGRLARWYTRRGQQRYFHGEPVYGPPPSETAYPTRRYPHSPPPPARPPEASP
ncbi:MAG TPA: hypothetical protein VD963_06095 [Phycisphaerales bacterium]|nr:hypothetical protein [Phycisphaerales bacterium]